MLRIILASSSPRRRALLRQLGLTFSVVASGYRENLALHRNPGELVTALSCGKARDVARRYPHALVIAADTIVAAGREVLGKPRSRTEARVQLEKLNGRAHEVLTGFTIIHGETKRAVTRVVRTKVYFRALARPEIDSYVRSKKWQGFAGAYAIQKYACVFVQKIEGDYFNVVGLPLCPLAQELKKFGVR